LCERALFEIFHNRWCKASPSPSDSLFNVEIQGDSFTPSLANGIFELQQYVVKMIIWSLGELLLLIPILLLLLPTNPPHLRSAERSPCTTDTLKSQTI
jgi:hypothetical protein